MGVLDDLGLVEGAVGMNHHRAETTGARPEPDAVPYSDGLTSGPNGQIDLAIAMANGELGGTAALTVVADGLRDLVAETNRECGTRQANPVRALR